MQLLLTTSNHEEIYRTDDSILVSLPKNRATLSTSLLNGGYREDILAVFNHQPPHRASCASDLEGGSVDAYLGLVSERLGRAPQQSTGLLTAAEMRHAALVTTAFRGVEVTAVVTAGIEVNGGRAGDPASYFQEDGRYQMISGTINTILIIGARLPAPTMVRAVMTATEAKTAVLQELMAQSRYSTGIATGSGTDGIVVISDTAHQKVLTDAGKHAKLGELIATAVMKATRTALDRQSDLNPASQQDLLVRMSRYAVQEEDLWREASRMSGENRRRIFTTVLRETGKDPAILAAGTAVIHIIDEISWGLIPDTAGRTAARLILGQFAALCEHEPDTEELHRCLDGDEPVLSMLIRAVAWVAKQRMSDRS